MDYLELTEEDIRKATEGNPDYEGAAGWYYSPDTLTSFRDVFPPTYRRPYGPQPKDNVCGPFATREEAERDAERSEP